MSPRGGDAAPSGPGTIGKTLLALLALLAIWAATITSCGSPPMRPGDDRLPDCPGSPNCVNSQDPDPGHRVEPLRFTGSADAAWARLREVVDALPRTTVVESDDRYLHVTFRTAWLRFVDDVQFLLDRQAGLVHLRSASRVGWSDLGANRRRVEAIRRAWETAREAAGGAGESSP